MRSAGTNKSRCSVYLHGYIHCWPQGNEAVPFSVISIPSESGFCSGSVPFVCKLFPRQPGYVMTVCALANDADATTASSHARMYMFAIARAIRAGRH